MFHIKVCLNSEPLPHPIPIKTSSKASTDNPAPPSSPKSDLTDICYIESGNSETIEGKIHFYRKVGLSSKQYASSNVLLMLSIPNTYSLGDLVRYLTYYSVSPSFIRFLRDGSVGKMVSLLGFNTIEESENAYKRLNGQEFRESPSIYCHLVFVESVEFYNSTKSSTTSTSTSTSTGCSTPTAESTEKSTDPFKIKDDLTELPTCTICLERLDSNISGILITSCNHEFHSKCLEKYSNSECPLCRHFEGNTVESTCDECKYNHNLWICVICGHIGCDRFHAKHAILHYEESGHAYSMELETQRVWDYVSNQYVHRLIQDQKDGQIVEFPSNDEDENNEDNNSHNNSRESSSDNPSCKNEVRFEYESLMTSLLETQKNFYLSELNKQQQYYENIIHENELKLGDMEEKNKELLKRINDDNNKIHNLEKRLGSDEDIEFLKNINKSLELNKSKYDSLLKSKMNEVVELKNRIKDLEESLEDVMKNFEVKERLDSMSDVDKESTIFIPKNKKLSRRSKK